MTSTEQREPGPGAVGTAHPLDAAAWASLTGPHARFAEGGGRVRRYRVEVSPFAALAPGADATVWDELLQLAGPGQSIGLSGRPDLLKELPAGWAVLMDGAGFQFVATEALTSGEDEEAVPLGAADAAEMLELVERTRPGPFRSHTYELGTYLGIRRGGALVAMAGERLHPPGWTEISAVCTDPAYRGQGLGARLVRAVAHGIRGRGETPFLHTAATNENAIRLYRALGFELRRSVGFFVVQSPGKSLVPDVWTAGVGGPSPSGPAA